MFNLFRPSRRIYRPGDTLGLSMGEGDCPRCGRRKGPRGVPHGLGVAGLYPAMRKCKCCVFPCPNCVPPYVDVEFSGITACTYCRAHGASCSVRISSLSGQNGTFRLDTYVAGGCHQYWLPESGVTVLVEFFENGSCSGTPVCSVTKEYMIVAQLCCIGDELQVNVLTGYEFATFSGTPACCPASSCSCVTGDVQFFGSTLAAGVSGKVITNEVALCADTSPDHSGTGGTCAITWPDVPEFSTSEQCSFCASCVQPDDAVSCGNDCCTPSTIRATVSGVTVNQTCILGLSGLRRWRLDGTTAINRTIDLAQTSSCTWEASVSSDYVLRRFNNILTCTSQDATFTIDTIKYTRIRTGATTFTWEVTGYEGVTPRVSFVGDDDGTCTFSSMSGTDTTNNCADMGSATHPARTACASSTSNAGIFGSGGSTTFTACP